VASHSFIKCMRSTSLHANRGAANYHRPTTLPPGCRPYGPAYLATAGTSYPPLTLSGPTGTAAVSRRRGFFTSCASASKASRSSRNEASQKVRAQKWDPLFALYEIRRPHNCEDVRGDLWDVASCGLVNARGR
jgi:hypothetical protein